LTVKTPSLYLAAGQLAEDFDEEQPPSGWNMLQALDLVPPWELITKTAVRTCVECELSSVASEDVCGRCPAVMMLRDLVAEVIRVR
jgi:hypothetical protein